METLDMLADPKAMADLRKGHVLIRNWHVLAPQEMNLDRFFSIRRILLYHAGFFGIARREALRTVDELLERFHLAEKADLPYYRLSGGMQKRLLVAKAVVTRPRILILDEPTAGIDVEQRHELWNYLRHLNRDGTTVILTTHYIDEAEALCRRVGIIHLGEIREMGSPEALMKKYCEEEVIVRHGSLEEVFLKVTGKRMEAVTLEQEEGAVIARNEVAKQSSGS